MLQGISEVCYVNVGSESLHLCFLSFFLSSKPKIWYWLSAMKKKKKAPVPRKKTSRIIESNFFRIFFFFNQHFVSRILAALFNCSSGHYAMNQLYLLSLGFIATPCGVSLGKIHFWHIRSIWRTLAPYWTGSGIMTTLASNSFCRSSKREKISESSTTKGGITSTTGSLVNLKLSQHRATWSSTWDPGTSWDQPWLNLLTLLYHL